MGLVKKYPVPEKISKFASVFREHGFRLYIVGGAVRDFLLGLPNSDFDFCTDALPEQVMGIFRSVIPTGIKHGTVTVLFKGNSFEVAIIEAVSSSGKLHGRDSYRDVPGRRLCPVYGG